VRAVLDRGIAVIARLVVRWLFRSVELEGFDRLREGRPTLIVANHFNGLVDPVLIVAGMRRLPRFMAKGTLWKVVPARPFLRLAGIVPVHRASDGDTAGNAEVFARVVDELADDGTVAIFPEGTTHDEPRLAEVRTGAARIAALAWAGPAPDLVIVPVGITYEDKVAIRSRVLLRSGPPLRSDVLGRSVSIEDHEAVHQLTERIGEAITALSPDYASRLEAGGLGRAAEVTLRRGEQRVPLADRERLARRLADLDDEPRQRVINEVARYELGLDLVGVSDPAINPVPTTRHLLWRLLRIAVPMVLVAPFAVAGFFINTIPALIVAAAGRAVTAPVTKGTVRVLVGMVVFPLTWLALAVWDVGGGVLEGVLRAVAFPLSPVLDAIVEDRAGFWPSLLVFVCCPLFGLATLWLLDHLTGLLRSWADWRAVGNRRGQLPDLLALRAELVADVTDLDLSAPDHRNGG
jgi:1-acyl-sn-glycerol-3-phosphate acyltransferase